MFEIGASKCPPTAKKLRGGYYTPQPLADYLCNWAIRRPDDLVLEPSCGDGSFIRAAAPRLSTSGSITAIELVADEIAKAQRSLADIDPSIEWKCGSFFDFAPQHLPSPSFDVIVGNPPFIRFTPNDLANYRKAHPSKLISLSGVNRPDFPQSLERYIQSGEANGVHRGYKCRVRNRWFDVPSVYAPDAFMYRQIHHAPLLIANHTGATSTDTVHRVRLLPTRNIEVEKLCGSLVNSVSFASSEVLGRSYGGGVLELEPREAEKLPIPFSEDYGVDVDYLDKKLRAGDLEAALDHGDDVLLREGCGLSKTDIDRARSAWRRLRDRRHSRKHGQRS